MENAEGNADGPEDCRGAVRAVADASVLSAIKSFFPGAQAMAEESIPDPGDEVWVYAHSIRPGNTARADHGGLRRLEDLLGNPQFPMVPVRVFGFSDQDGYGEFSYLTRAESIEYARLPAGKWQHLRRLTPEDEAARVLLSLHASEHSMEGIFRAQRHEFRGLTAAVRLYLGMLLVGHADAGRAEEVLKELANAAAAQPDLQITLRLDLPERLARHGRLVDRLREDRPTDLPRHYSMDPPTGPIVMLDDHYQDHLWDRVLRKLCPPRKLWGFGTWDGLMHGLGPKGVRPGAVVLLDCNLGRADIPTGMERLHAIRRAYPEVKVVMLSAFDDAQVMLSAMRQGADDYYVKELENRGDRSSLDYYLRFCEAISVDDERCELVYLWRQFQRKLHPSGPTIHPSSPELGVPEGFESLLRLAFYLLFSRADGALRWTWHMARGQIGKVEDRCIGAALKALSAGWPELRDEPRLPSDARAFFSDAAHGESIAWGEAIRAVRQTLALLRDADGRARPVLLDDPRMPLFCPFSRPDLQTGAYYPGIEDASARPPHTEAGARAAVELARGKWCSDKCDHGSRSELARLLSDHSVPAEPPENGPYRDVVMIDDEGERTGWVRVAKHAWPGVQCFPSVDDFIGHFHEPRCVGDLSRVSVVFLDLLMPTADKGFESLARIRTWDPGVPIVVLSASAEALNAARCLRRGATDFVSKSLGIERDLLRCQRFAADLRGRIAVARKLLENRRMREFWWRWGQVSADGPGLGSDEEVVNRQVELVQGSVRTDRHVVIPAPSAWPQRMAEGLSLPLWLYHNWTLDELNKPYRIGGADYVVQMVPIDDWRFEHLLRPSAASLAKTVCLLCCSFTEELAMWDRCLGLGASFDRRSWGIDGGINVTDVMMDFCGPAEKLWSWRNDMLYSVPGCGGISYNREFMEQCLDESLKVVDRFAERAKSRARLFRMSNP